MMPTVKPSVSSAAAPDSTSTAPARQMSREVAHELNNILCIIQGYAERLQLKHCNNPALCPDLQVICDNARRAALVVQVAATRQTAALPARSAE